MVSQVLMMTKVNMDALRVETATWQSQFHDAMNVNGGDVANATPFDYLMHFLTFSWKVWFRGLTFIHCYDLTTHGLSLKMSSHEIFCTFF